MNILTLVPDLKAPSCRFRVLQYIKPLGELGIDLHVTELPKERGKRRDLFRTAGDFEAVFIHRRLLSGLDYRCLRKHARRLILDFDDAVMFRDSNAARLNSRRRAKRFQRLAGGVDLVLAGNDYLAGWAGRYNPRVVIIPTVIDLTFYPSSPHRGRGRILGWMGTKSNFIYLDLLSGVISPLSKKYSEIKLKVVSDSDYYLPGVEVINKKWALSEEVEDLLGFDLGIMPLTDDDWTRGKCALKIIQYFAAFLPVVCSPVGTNQAVVREGTNGYFARSTEEWVDRLDTLLSSPEKRDEMGRAGRRLVEERYSLSVMVPRLAETLRSVI